MYSQNVTSTPVDLTVTISNSSPVDGEDVSRLGVFKMDETNKLLLRSQPVPALLSTFTIETKGSGCAMVQTVLRYNTPDSPQNSGFTLTATQEGSDLNVCGTYTGSQPETGMVVMEVEMVSGWRPSSLRSRASSMMSTTRCNEWRGVKKTRTMLFSTLTLGQGRSNVSHFL